MSRQRFQSLALTVLGLLLIAFGATRLRAAIGSLFAHERFAHEHVHDVPPAPPHPPAPPAPPRAMMVTVSARAVLFDETFRVTPGSDLHVDLGSENVTVRTGSGDRARVVVEGRGRDAEAEFQRRRFSARTDGGDLVVRTDPPRRRVSLGRTDAQFQVTIEIPRRFSALLDLGSGNVDIASLEGDLRVDVGSGNVRVADVDGARITLDTGSGNVSARTLRGDVHIDTGSGNVSVDRVEGSLEVDTGSGNVAVGTVDGPAEVGTGSGGVEMTLRSAAAVRISTGSGPVSIGVPRGAGFDVDIEGSSVRIDEALRFSGHRERDEARGRLGSGGPALRVGTGSGPIQLRAG